ncbi:asparagine synthase-related protein [Desulfoluna spongiiphila]|uniref:asparagine synthase (glutamine-hydrolyzing) n=1 Tax=Desulfoluna spongiiphila TaxID=419481 RepID=A0A1G5BZA6_9BACT|nr:asparagine synthetase B family protein [Desulfoluna spongiiphila]SCX95559.1 Asparagine synthase [Desulfoluna spongiiphila]
MLVLGSTGEFRCSAKWVNESLVLRGPENGFFGYKLDSLSGDNGIYTEWNTNNDILTIFNDRFGMYPIYYTRTSSGVNFSSSIANLLADEDHYQIDSAAVAVFLRMGIFIGDTTPFSEIKALPPGAKLQFDRNGLSIENREISCGKNVTPSIKDAQNIYGELFKSSVLKFREAFPKKIGIPLSGGRDSRHIIFELMASGLKPYSCITMKHQPPKPNEDAKIAKEVCQYFNFKHVILEQDLSILRMEKEKNILTNFCSLDHSWILPLSRYLLEEGYDAIFDGIGGDVLSAGLFLTEHRLNLYNRNKFEELANEILGFEGHLPHMLTNSAYSRFNRDIAVNLLVQELKRYVNTPNPIGQFFFWNRTRRVVALSSWGILGQKTHVFAPYLDHELYNFLTSLPAEYFLDHTFHQNTIAKQYPAYAHLPYETKMQLPQKGGVASNYFQLAEFTRFSLGSLVKPSMCRPSFFYLRLFKSLLSMKYYDQFKGTYQVPIYLSQLAEYYRGI